MMDELWREEEKKTLERIAKLTELGKVKWECVEYNPLCFMNEDKVESIFIKSSGTSRVKVSAISPFPSGTVMYSAISSS